MQNRISIYIGLIALTLFFASCEKSIKVNLPPFTSKLTINCLTELNTQFVVTVGNTMSISSVVGVNPISYAKVSLYENGVLKEQLVYDSLSMSYYSSTIATSGNTYKLKVSANGFTDASAEVTAPGPTPITSINHIVEARKGIDGSMEDELTLQFQDPSMPNDYYLVSIIKAHDSTGYQFGGFCVFSSDPSIETSANELVDANTCLDNTRMFMRDGLFNGKQKELKLYANSDNLLQFPTFFDTTYPVLSLVHVPEACFRYYKSLEVAKNTKDDPFSEPVNVYSNVVNGYGLFAIKSSSSIELKP